MSLTEYLYPERSNNVSFLEKETVNIFEKEAWFSGDYEYSFNFLPETFKPFTSKSFSENCLRFLNLGLLFPLKRFFFDLPLALLRTVLMAFTLPIDHYQQKSVDNSREILLFNLLDMINSAILPFVHPIGALCMLFYFPLRVTSSLVHSVMKSFKKIAEPIQTVTDNNEEQWEEIPLETTPLKPTQKPSSSKKIFASLNLNGSNKQEKAKVHFNKLKIKYQEKKAVITNHRLYQETKEALAWTPSESSAAGSTNKSSSLNQ